MSTPLQPLQELLSKKSRNDSELNITPEFSLSSSSDLKSDIDSRLQGLNIDFLQLWLSTGDVSQMFLVLDSLEHKVSEFQDFLVISSDSFETGE